MRRLRMLAALAIMVLLAALMFYSSGCSLGDS
jgi:hypothetical protein